MDVGSALTPYGARNMRPVLPVFPRSHLCILNTHDVTGQQSVYAERDSKASVTCYMAC
jgi:hypothetical protein